MEFYDIGWDFEQFFCEHIRTLLLYKHHIQDLPNLLQLFCKGIPTQIFILDIARRLSLKTIIF